MLSYSESIGVKYRYISNVDLYVMTTSANSARVTVPGKYVHIPLDTTTGQRRGHVSGGDPRTQSGLHGAVAAEVLSERNDVRTGGQLPAQYLRQSQLQDVSPSCQYSLFALSFVSILTLCCLTVTPESIAN